MAKITPSRINTALLIVLVLVLVALLFQPARPAQAQNKVLVVVKTVTPGEIVELEPGWQAAGVSCLMTPQFVGLPESHRIYELPLCFLASTRAAGK